jgi:hypothetical protein
MSKFERFIDLVVDGGFPHDNFKTWLEEVAGEQKAAIPPALIAMQNTTSYQFLFKTTQELLKLAEGEGEKQFLLYLKKRASLLMLLQKKIKKNRELVSDSLDLYGFDEDYAKKVIYALSVGDLRTTDILIRDFSHLVWSFFTFKWGNFLNRGKQLSKKEVEQIADHSWEHTSFQRTREQEKNRLLKGIPLVTGKIITSMAICFHFTIRILPLLGMAHPIIIAVSIFLALCNGGVCALTRGKAMLDCAGFEPEKQKAYDTIEENTQEKSNLRWGSKIFFGVITLFACISAGASAWGGIVSALAFFGVVVAFSNPYLIVAVIGLAIIAGISFYAFQASGIEGNFFKFKNLFSKSYGTGGAAGIAKATVLVLISVVFLAVYATLTWFTTASGIDKIFKMCGNQKTDLFSLALSAISTTTTMVVNTCSQVSKVFDPKTYKDIREKILPVWNAKPDSPPQTRLQRAWNTTKTVAKCAMIIGDLTTYAIAGGIDSGESTGGTIGNLVGWAGSKLLFVILSPIILSAVAIAFSYPALFEKKKPKDIKDNASKSSVPPATNQTSNPSLTPGPSPTPTSSQTPSPTPTSSTIASTVMQSPVSSVDAKIQTPHKKLPDRNKSDSPCRACTSLSKSFYYTFIGEKQRSTSSSLTQVLESVLQS